MKTDIYTVKWTRGFQFKCGFGHPSEDHEASTCMFCISSGAEIDKTLSSSQLATTVGHAPGADAVEPVKKRARKNKAPTHRRTKLAGSSSDNCTRITLISGLCTRSLSKISATILHTRARSH